MTWYVDKHSCYESSSSITSAPWSCFKYVMPSHIRYKFQASCNLKRPEEVFCMFIASFTALLFIPSCDCYVADAVRHGSATELLYRIPHGFCFVVRVKFTTLV
jgi:hypothetical protein